MCWKLTVVRFLRWSLSIVNVEAKWMLVSYLILVVSIDGFCCEDAYKGGFSDMYGAVVNITYKDPITGEQRTEKREIGRYGTTSRMDSEYGWVVHVRTEDNKTHGCTPPINVPKSKYKWVALVERGSCKFHKKIQNAAMVRNASAVVIYNHKETDDLLTMDHNGEQSFLTHLINAFLHDTYLLFSFVSKYNS